MTEPITVEIWFEILNGEQDRPAGLTAAQIPLVELAMEYVAVNGAEDAPRFLANDLDIMFGSDWARIAEEEDVRMEVWQREAREREAACVREGKHA